MPTLPAHMDRPGPFEIDTPLGPRPFVPPGPELAPRPKDPDTGEDLPDNAENPRGKPSLSLPQQATPLTSHQGVLAEADLTDTLADPTKLDKLMAQDGLAPDNPLNSRGTPDYIVAPREPNGEEARDAGK